MAVCASPVLAIQRLHLFPRPPVQRIALVKPEKARAVEDQLLRAARMGQVRSGHRVAPPCRILPALSLICSLSCARAPSPQITERLTEERLISMLEKLNEGAQSGPKITIQRRRSALDDD